MIKIVTKINIVGKIGFVHKKRDEKLKNFGEIETKARTGEMANYIRVKRFRTFS